MNFGESGICLNVSDKALTPHKVYSAIFILIQLRVVDIVIKKCSVYCKRI